MAKCYKCKKEMLTADGCERGPIEFNGKMYEPIKMGGHNEEFEDFAYDSENERCGDCGAKRGHYHQ